MVYPQEQVSFVYHLPQQEKLPAQILNEPTKPKEKPQYERVIQPEEGSYKFFQLQPLTIERAPPITSETSFANLCFVLLYHTGRSLLAVIQLVFVLVPMLELLYNIAKYFTLKLFALADLERKIDGMTKVVLFAIEGFVIYHFTKFVIGAILYPVIVMALSVMLRILVLLLFGKA